MRRTRLLVIGHSASRTGAPKSLLAILRWLTANAPEYEITLVLGEGGPYVEDFRSCVERVHIRNEPTWHFRGDLALRLLDRPGLRSLGRLTRRLLQRRGQVSSQGFDVVYLSSAASLRLIGEDRSTCPVLLHVYELDYGIHVNLPGGDDRLRRIPDRYLACSQAVSDMLTARRGVPARQVEVVAPCLPDEEAERRHQPQADACNALGLDANRPVVVNVGGLDWRKGYDVFLATAVRVSSLAPDLGVQWVWVCDGDGEIPRMRARVAADRAGLATSLTLTPGRQDPRPYYDAASLLLLSSREEAFGLVAAEAALAGCPVVCQSAAACGAADFVARGGGVVAPYLDVDALADAVLTVLSRPDEATAMGARGRELVAADYLVSTIGPVVRDALSRTTKS